MARIVISLVTVGMLAVVLVLPNSFGQDPTFFPSKKSKPVSEQKEQPAEQQPAEQQPAEQHPSQPAGEIDQEAIFFPRVKKSAQPAADPVDTKPVPQSQPPVAPVNVDPDPKPAVDPAKIAKISADLSRTLKKQIDDVVLPSLKAERDNDFVQSVGKLIERLDTQTLDTVEAYAQAHGHSIRKHFISLLGQAIERQEKLFVPDLKLDVIEYINSGLRKNVEIELVELNQHLVMQDQPQLPASWRDCEQLFWEVHVWKNRMTNVGRMSEYGVAIQKRLLDRAQKRDDKRAINRLQPTVMMHNKVQQHFRKMIEGEAVLRIAELEKSEKTLRESDDFEERLSAAFAMELHGDALGKLFAEYPSGSFLRESLNDADLSDRCDGLLASGRDVGKDVVEKAMLLRRGAHWWLRGRYGEGPLAYGLLKSKKATESEMAMFGLYMPKERPVPVGEISSDDSVAPGYNRRHYYTWAVERRDLVTESYKRATGSSSETKTEKKTNGRPTYQQFW